MDGEEDGALWVGVDVGGTKIAVLVADHEDRIRSKVVVPTPLHSPAATLQGISDAVRQAVTLAGADLNTVAAVGVGIPGYVDRATGSVQYAVNLRWGHMSAGPLLTEALGVPCVLENDVRMATLGLQHHPLYEGRRNLVYMSIGTGIGAGVILGGRLHSGIHSMAGEIGHWIVESNGPRCACGAHGCLEMFAAGPAIARRAQEAANDSQATRLRGQAALTAREVYQIADEGDPVAQGIVRQASGYLARALYQVILAYDVEYVILGGGVARAGHAFLAPILGELERLGSESDLARMLLPPDRFALLPDGYEAGTWGGVALARDFHQHNSVARSGSKG